MAVRIAAPQTNEAPSVHTLLTPFRADISWIRYEEANQHPQKSLPRKVGPVYLQTSSGGPAEGIVGFFSPIGDVSIYFFLYGFIEPGPSTKSTTPAVLADLNFPSEAEIADGRSIPI